MASEERITVDVRCMVCGERWTLQGYDYIIATCPKNDHPGGEMEFTFLGGGGGGSGVSSMVVCGGGGTPGGEP